MKKIIFITLFAACASLGVSSCMNGDYDANPTGVASGTNPLIPVPPAGGNIGVAARGEIRFRLNGANITLTNGKYMDGSPRIMTGSIQYAGGEKQVGFTIDNYTGAATYTITETENRGRYTLVDYNTTPIMKDYLTTQPGGMGQIIVTNDANNEMVGTFSFTAFYNGEKVELTSGSFHLVKQ